MSIQNIDHAASCKSDIDYHRHGNHSVVMHRRVKYSVVFLALLLNMFIEVILHKVRVV